MVLRTKATMVRRHRDQEDPISDNDKVAGRRSLVGVQVDGVNADGERNYVERGCCSGWVLRSCRRRSWLFVSSS
jgi:hypothetical protein